MDEAGIQADAFEQLCAQLFAEAGWQIARSSRAGEPDILIAKEGVTYVIEVKVARDGRRSILEALLADAVLRAQALARKKGASTRPLALVAAPVLSTSMSVALRDYAREFAPDVAFGLVDGRGRFEVYGEGLEGLQGAPARRPRRARPVASHATDLFSDLNQWMLKILLGKALPDELLSVPRGRIEGAADLARLAKTSLPSAWRFLSALEDAGFVEESEAGLELVRRDDLMGAWLGAVRRSHLELRAALTLPVREPLQVLAPPVIAYRSSDRRIAWATFAAASQLGHPFVRGAPLHLYVEDLGDATLDMLKLVPAAEHERSDVILRKPRWPEAVFRSIVTKNGQPVTDIVQCWLDVSQHPARGQEQGDILWRRSLAPALGLDERRSAIG